MSEEKRPHAWIQTAVLLVSQVVFVVFFVKGLSDSQSNLQVSVDRLAVQVERMASEVGRLAATGEGYSEHLRAIDHRLDRLETTSQVQKWERN